MLLPISILGSPVLRKKAEEIDENYQGLNELIENMFQTMYHADGVGLAAPQVGLSISLFVVDATPAAEDEPSLEGFKKVFINPRIIETSDKKVSMNEGCLSIPGINEDVSRPESVTIEYYDENWELREDTFTGFAARVVQHEYDHLLGNVFVDKISIIRKKLIKLKLGNITKGKFRCNYRFKLAK